MVQGVDGGDSLPHLVFSQHPAFFLWALGLVWSACIHGWVRVEGWVGAFGSCSGTLKATCSEAWVDWERDWLSSTRSSGYKIWCHMLLCGSGLQKWDMPKGTLHAELREGTVRLSESHTCPPCWWPQPQSNVPEVPGGVGIRTQGSVLLADAFRLCYYNGSILEMLSWIQEELSALKVSDSYLWRIKIKYHCF